MGEVTTGSFTNSEKGSSYKGKARMTSRKGGNVQTHKLSQVSALM